MPTHEAAIRRAVNLGRQDALLHSVVNALGASLELAGLAGEEPDLDAFLSYSCAWEALALRDFELALPPCAPPISYEGELNDGSREGELSAGSDPRGLSEESDPRGLSEGLPSFSCSRSLRSTSHKRPSVSGYMPRAAVEGSRRSSIGESVDNFLTTHRRMDTQSSRRLLGDRSLLTAGAL